MLPNFLQFLITSSSLHITDAGVTESGFQGGYTRTGYEGRGTATRTIELDKIYAKTSKLNNDA